MSLFVESPWPALVLGLTLEVILGVWFLRSGRATAVVAMGVVLVAMTGMIFVEQLVVSETEEVEDTLHGVAEALSAGDMQTALAAISPSCAQLPQFRRALDEVNLSSAWIGSDLEVRLNPLSSPASATAFFTGHAEGQDKQARIPYERFMRKFKIRLERDRDRWLITQMEDADPRQGMFP